MDKGKIIQLLKGYSTDSEYKLETSIDYDRIENLANDLVNLFAIHFVSQQRELLLDFANSRFGQATRMLPEEKVNGYMTEKSNNCG